MNIGDTLTYNYTGAFQQVTLDPGKYDVECWGAEGGTGYTGGSPLTSHLGGKGGYVKGTIQITASTTVYLYVGGKGTNGSGAGGWNGGGAGKYFAVASAGAGGGASDIRIGGQALSNRVLIGAGGGGGGGNTQTSAKGGDGGGLTGATADSNGGKGGTGGTQSAGGINGGALGTGGASGSNNATGGGGGGYYGGGAGRDYYEGGGGGSSYYGGIPKYPVTGATTTAGVQTGNGQIKLTLQGPPDFLSYDYTGGVQTINLTAGRYRFELWGAQGGGGWALGSGNYNNGGRGGYVKGELTFDTATTVYLYIGGQGTTGGTAGGWNGGGNGANYNGADIGAGGGGATDLRINGQTLNDRVLVAGGGGGGTGNGSDIAGAGGGLTGGTATWVAGQGGTGGTQTAGGANGGALGIGGSAQNSWAGYGAGGGGYYGGGCASGTASGGGGSSYYGGTVYYPVVNGTTTANQQVGNGYAQITQLPLIAMKLEAFPIQVEATLSVPMRLTEDLGPVNIALYEDLEIGLPYQSLPLKSTGEIKAAIYANLSLKKPSDFTPPEEEPYLPSFQSGIGDNLDCKVKFDDSIPAEESFQYELQLKAYKPDGTAWYGKKQTSFKHIVGEGQTILIHDRLVSPVGPGQKPIDSTWTRDLDNYKLIVTSLNPNVQLDVVSLPDNLAPYTYFTDVIDIQASIINPSQAGWSPAVHNGFYYFNQAEYYLYAENLVKAKPTLVDQIITMIFSYKLEVVCTKDGVVITYKIPMTGSLQVDDKFHKVNVKPVANIANDYFIANNINTTGLNIVAYNATTGQEGVELRVAAYVEAKAGDLALTNMTDWLRVPVQLVDGLYQALVTPIPQQGAPVSIRDDSGYEMIQVNFMDENGLPTLDNTEVFSTHDGKREFALAFESIDPETLVATLDGAEIDYTLDGTVVTIGDIGELFGTEVKFTYKLRHSYYVDYNFDVFNDCALICLYQPVFQGVDKYLKISYETNKLTAYYQASEVNVNPLLNPLNSGFIYIVDKVYPVVSIDLKFNPNKILANGKDKVTITATALDRFGNPVVGEYMHFSVFDAVSKNRGTITTINSVTDQFGVAKIIYTSDKTPDRLNVRVTNSNQSAYATKYLYQVPENPQVRLSLSRNGPEVRGWVVDNLTGPLQNVLVNFYTSYGAFIGGGSAAYTNSQGMAFRVLDDDWYSGETLITVIVPSYGLSQEMIINF